MDRKHEALDPNDEASVRMRQKESLEVMRAEIERMLRTEEYPVGMLCVFAQDMVQDGQKGWGLSVATFGSNECIEMMVTQTADHLLDNVIPKSIDMYWGERPD